MNTPTTETPKDWLISYFQTASGAEVSASGDVNYFDAGFIDSVDVIWLVESAEEAFGIRFTDAHFRDPRFATIDGLAEMIAEIQDA